MEWKKQLLKQHSKSKRGKMYVVHRDFASKIYQFKSVIDESLIQGDGEGFADRHGHCLHFIRLCN